MDLSEDIDLDDLFQECALEYDGKFYAMSAALIDFICEQLKDYSTENDMLFFYDTFYDKYISVFSGYGVTTSEMLKSVLEKEVTNYYYKSNCLFRTYILSTFIYHIHILFNVNKKSPALTVLSGQTFHIQIRFNT